MIRLRYIPFALVLTFSFCVHETQAQRTPNYNRRPTISPYVNLFNSNQGGVNNYFSFVRPLQEQARFNQQQSNQNQFLQQQFQQQQFGQNRNTFGPGGQSGMLRQGTQGIGQPSTTGGFFNYSHYYTMPRISRRR